MEIIKRLKLAVFAGVPLLAGGLPAQETFDSATVGPPVDQQVPVAEEETLPGEDEPAPELTDEERLIAQFERYKQLMSDSVFDEADSVAKSVVELAIRVAGPRSNDTARALTNLAIVQHRTRQYDAAQQNFEAAVDIIEDNEDRLNGMLVNPLKGLGAAQLEGGRPDLASTTFARAVHVTHVNEGPHNFDQVSILESLAEANLRLGSIEDAKQVQDTIYSLNLRRHADNVLELVPALMRRASWQHRAGFIYDERATYRRVIRILEQQHGKDALQLVNPLTKLGQSFFFLDTSGEQSVQQATMTSGEIYFKRATRIAEEHPESDWQVVAGTRLALGDYYMFEGNEQRARKVYQNVWDLLSEDEDRLDLRRKALEELVVLRESAIPEYVTEPGAGSTAPSDDQIIQGRISVSYVVSRRGRAANIKVVEAEPAEFDDMLRSVQREMRRRIYRPQFDESGPVVSAEKIMTHRFYYRQSDLDAVRNGTTDAKPSEEG